MDGIGYGIKWGPGATSCKKTKPNFEHWTICSTASLATWSDVSFSHRSVHGMLEATIILVLISLYVRPMAYLKQQPNWCLCFVRTVVLLEADVVLAYTHTLIETHVASHWVRMGIDCIRRCIRSSYTSIAHHSLLSVLPIVLYQKTPHSTGLGLNLRKVCSTSKPHNSTNTGFIDMNDVSFDSWDTGLSFGVSSIPLLHRRQ